MRDIPLRVLLIEDDEDDYVLICSLLSQTPASRFTVEWASTYDAGLQAIDSGRYDVCLLDYRLGERNGLDFLQEVQSKGCKSPVIFVTGEADYEVDRRAMRAGAADYLVKGSITTDILERAIRYCINRKSAEDSLRESEAKFRALAESIAYGIFIVHGDDVLYVNHAGEALCGRGAHSRPVADDSPVVHPNVKEFLRAGFRMPAQGNNTILRRELQVGAEYGKARWLDCTSTGIDYGGRRAVLGTAVDITRRKEAEEALRNSEAYYRAIVEDQTEFICRFLSDGTITFANKAYCSCLAKARDELIGSIFTAFVHEEDRRELERRLSQLSPQAPVGTMECRVTAPDGEIRWQQWTYRMILDDGNQQIGYQAVGRDVTERRKMEEALLESAEKIKLFAYSVSHDLRSPAIGIHGLARLLHKQHRNALNTKGRRYCDQILKASEQVVALVDEINFFIKTKEAPIRTEKISIVEILRAIRDEFSVQLTSRGISWVEINTDISVSVRADRLSILRVFRNLVENALKYGGEKLSEICIGYEESGDYHVFTVTDNGVGIARKDFDRIFGVFQRNAVSKGIPGTGLGLAIVKEIAERHHGKVWVEPGAEGGTKFLFAIAKNLGDLSNGSNADIAPRSIQFAETLNL